MQLDLFTVKKKQYLKDLCQTRQNALSQEDHMQNNPPLPN